MNKVEKYHSVYVDMRFERGDLFRLVREHYHPTEVLYPGCSIHLTPAFYFPHVCFVDRSPEAADFFANRELLLDFIGRQRQYRRKPYIQFIEQDFTQPLPVRESQFDLLLALFTAGVSQACNPYLKKGGLILTNNHQDDAVEAANDKGLALITTIQKRQGKYKIRAVEPDMPIKVYSQEGPTKRYLRQTSNGAEYIENEVYYLFRKK